MGGLTNLIKQLGDLAENSKDLQETKQFGDPGEFRESMASAFGLGLVGSGVGE